MLTICSGSSLANVVAIPDFLHLDSAPGRALAAPLDLDDTILGLVSRARVHGLVPCELVGPGEALFASRVDAGERLVPSVGADLIQR